MQMGRVWRRDRQGKKDLIRVVLTVCTVADMGPTTTTEPRPGGLAATRAAALTLFAFASGPIWMLVFAFVVSRLVAVGASLVPSVLAGWIIASISVSLITPSHECFHTAESTVSPSSAAPVSVEPLVGSTGAPSAGAPSAEKPLDLEVNPALAQASNLQSIVMDEIKLSTKGDREVRDVRVNNSKVPRELVEDAMFRNNDFAPPEGEFPLRAVHALVDPNTAKQRGMFGKMTHPL
jgi:hypothetical protein